MRVGISFKYRIALAIFVVAAPLTLLVLWKTQGILIQSIEVQQHANQEVVIRPLAGMSRVALMTEEYADLQPYIEQMLHEQKVLHVLLSDHAGRVVASTRLRDVGKQIPPLSADTDDVWRVERIGNSSGELGTLAVKFSNSGFHEAMGQARALAARIAMGGALLVAAIALVVSTLLTRRINVLTQVAQRLADGNLNTRTGFDESDEIGRLGKAFDTMGERICEHIRELKNSRERFELAVRGSNEGIWDWNIENGEVYYSPRWKEILGYAPESDEIEPNIQAWHSRIHPDDRENLLSTLDACLTPDGGLFSSDHRLRGPDGAYIWVSAHARALRDDTGRAVRMAGSLTDISERKEHEALMRHHALHDALTGLPNRSLLNDRLQQAIRVARRDAEQLAVMMMDVDRFKEINDTLGHPIGDRVLQQVSERLRTALRESDTIARFGGDEFVVILPDVGADQVPAVAHKLLAALETYFNIDDHSFNVEASIGVALFPQHGSEAHELIKSADVAMYAAKREQGGGYQIYDPSIDTNSQERLGLAGDMRRGIDNGEMLVFYQPKMDVRSGTIYGAEALLRWQHPKKGMISPNVFIPLAEQSGLIHPLTRWVIAAALQQQSEWRRQGIDLSVSVNLSTRNLQDLSLPNEVQRLLKIWEVDPKYLELEITESAIMVDPARALKILTKFDDMGVQLSIDDFGTGYSSLAYLRRLPVDEIKIDRSFVMDIATSDNNDVIVRSTIELAHNLGHRVVAEGVENQHVLDLLRGLGCDAVQGYYLSKPLPEGEFVSWLVARTEQQRRSKTA